MTQNDKTTIGWREWLALPDLGIDRIKAKVDSGAKTSCLHAHFVEPFERDGERYVRFGIHPLQGDNETSITCECWLSDQREVTDSGGHKEMRYVITTRGIIGDREHEIELTLTNRDTMKFRMLLGRAVMTGNYIIDPELSYNAGKPEQG